MVVQGALGQQSEARLEFEAFESLPCGCVTAAYLARPWDVPVVSVEARGPYCVLTEHVVGAVLRLGEFLEPAFDGSWAEP